MAKDDRKPTHSEPDQGSAQGESPAEEVRLSSDMERAAAIASVMRHQAQREEAQLTASPVLKTRPLLTQLSTLAVATAFSVYVWFGSPRWLEPDPIPLPTLEAEEDLVRSAILLQAERIQAYREENGRLPAFLMEAGPVLPGVRYDRLDSRTFRIHGSGERLSFTYSSGEPMDEYQASLEAILGSTLDR